MFGDSSEREQLNDVEIVLKIFCIVEETHARFPTVLYVCMYYVLCADDHLD